MRSAHASNGFYLENIQQQRELGQHVNQRTKETVINQIDKGNENTWKR